MVTMPETQAELVRIGGMKQEDLAERERRMPPKESRKVVFDVSGLGVSYSGQPALKDVSLEVYRNFVTAFIGPSGCGKSTFIRCFNRMNDLIPGANVEGKVLYHGQDLYNDEVDPVEVRRRIGMVFQKPNPFPKSIYDNVAFGPRVLGMDGSMDDIVERALIDAALSVGRTAATPLHRPLPRSRAGRAAHGRARVGPRPDRDDQDRGSHA